MVIDGGGGHATQSSSSPPPPPPPPPSSSAAIATWVLTSTAWAPFVKVMHFSSFHVVQSLSESLAEGILIIGMRFGSSSVGHHGHHGHHRHHRHDRLLLLLRLHRQPTHTTYLHLAARETAASDSLQRRRCSFFANSQMTAWRTANNRQCEQTAQQTSLS